MQLDRKKREKEKDAAKEDAAPPVLANSLDDPAAMGPFSIHVFCAGTTIGNAAAR